MILMIHASHTVKAKANFTKAGLVYASRSAAMMKLSI